MTDAQKDFLPNEKYGSVRYHRGTQIDQVPPPSSQSFFTHPGGVAAPVWKTISSVLTLLAHNLLSSTHSDTTAGTVTRGDIITGQGASAKWTRLAASVPGANILNVLGFANGDTEPAYKTVLDSTAPTTIAASDSATAGTSLVFAHRDHRHGSPATYPSTSGTNTTTARFGAHRLAASGNQTMTSGSFTTAIFDSADFDPGSNYNTTTGTFTAPVTGYYQLNTSVNINATTSAAPTSLLVSFFVNGTEKVRGQRTDVVAGSNFGLAASALISLTANDAVTVQAFQNSGVNGALTPSTAAIMTFSGHLLST